MVSIAAQVESLHQGKSLEVETFVRSSRDMARTLAQEFKRKGWTVIGGAENSARHFVDATAPDQQAQVTRDRLADIGIYVDLSVNAQGEAIRFETPSLVQREFTEAQILALADELHRNALDQVRSATTLGQARATLKNILKGRLEEVQPS